MTPISPLQLRAHLFSHVLLRANPSGTIDGEQKLEPFVSCDPDPERPNHWRLIVAVKLSSVNPQKPFAYEIEVQVQGLVEVHEKFDAAKREQLARVNGAGLLYAAARELILNLTARSAHGPVCIPTLNFSEVFAQAQKNNAGEASTEKK
jgi:preprotein translocase subunit SecB